MYCPKVILLAILLFTAQQLLAQVKGTVTSEQGEPIPGVTVVEKGTSNGTITNFDGQFQIDLQNQIESTLVFSFIGMQTQELPVGSNSVLDVVLKEATTDLDEVVVVGYGQQTKASVVGAISTASAEDLVKAPVGSVTTAMVGRLTGLTTVQNSGQPGGESPQLRIRGISTLNSAEPLVIVDGVERSAGGFAGSSIAFSGYISGYEQMNPNDIESVSILKDASATAVYGVKGANGVIIITTKKGIEGKSVIKYSGSYGISRPIRMRQNLESYDYGFFANEGNRNDGQSPYMSFDDMMKYRYNYNPLLYPSINYNDYLLEDYAPKQTHNLSIRGGTDKVRYFSSVGYYDEDGLIKNDDAYGFDPNNHYKRLNMRTNIDFQFTKRFSASLNIDARFETRNGSNAPHDASFWWKMYQAHPWVSPGFDEENRFIETYSEKEIPIFQWILQGGNYQRQQTTANTVFSAKHDLDFLTKGLSVQGKFSYDSFVDNWHTRSRSYATYQPIEVDGEIYLKQSGEDGQLNYSRQPSGKSKKEYYEASLNYSRNFGDHAVSGLALYNQEKRYYSESQFPDVPRAYLGFVARATYAYKSKYFAEFNFGLNGSENFPKGKRFGKFPAYSVGWLVSDEAFMKNIKPISYFKIRGSHGSVGSDRTGASRFLYIEGSFVDYPGNYRAIFGEPTTNTTTTVPLQEGTAANNDVTWETATKSNIGFDAKFFKNRLNLVVDLFQEKRDNILTTMQTLPWLTFPQMGFGGTGFTTGDYSTRVNYAKVENKGFEVELGWDGDIGNNVQYYLKGSYSYSINKATRLSEAKQNYPWMYNQGLALGEQRGLIAQGYWDSFEEINNPNNPYNTFQPNPIPGDIKYKDVNGDMKIDRYDVVPLGNGNLPRSTFTTSLGLSYKGFDISVLFQGATDVIFHPSNEGQIQMHEGWGGYDWIEERWTPQTRDGYYPVLHGMDSKSPSASNYQQSSYWAYDATYVRLKNLEIGYAFEQNITNRLGIAGLRVFVTGQNLLTWTPTHEMNRYDPEMIQGRQVYHPIMQVYNTGVSVTF